MGTTDDLNPWISLHLLQSYSFVHVTPGQGEAKKLVIGLALERHDDQENLQMA